MSKETKNLISQYFRHNSFIEESKKLMTELRRQKKELLKCRKDVKCPLSTEVERFIDSDAVGDVVKGVVEKGKVETDKELMIARAYQLKRKSRAPEDM